jgi:hypothetical protein
MPWRPPVTPDASGSTPKIAFSLSRIVAMIILLEQVRHDGAHGTSTLLGRRSPSERFATVPSDFRSAYRGPTALTGMRRSIPAVPVHQRPDVVEAHQRLNDVIEQGAFVDASSFG